MPASLATDQNPSNLVSKGETRPIGGHRRTGAHHDHPGTPFERPGELVDRPGRVGQRQVRRREDAVLVGEAPVLLEPAVEGAEQQRDRLGVVRQRLLVDHPEGREQPAGVEPLLVERGDAGDGVAEAGRMGSRAASMSSGLRPSGFPRKKSYIAPGIATGSKVGLVTAREICPPSRW